MISKGNLINAIWFLCLKVSYQAWDETIYTNIDIN